MAKQEKAQNKQATPNKKDKAGKQQVAETKPVENFIEEKLPARLFDKYKSEIIAKLMTEFNYKSVMEVPKLVKIVVNMGVGEAVQDSKLLDEAIKDLETITGQKASVRIARKSISNFKLRENMKIGAMVTLRSGKMYEFLDRFVTLALPRVRDFKGISDKSFDGRGNYSIGIKEQIIFPEINIDKINKVRGMDITFVTTAKTDKEAYALLSAFGVPFRKKEIN
ncbi:MAG TPA: 50S ribosomal protein L5 [Melioribacteraceae bacterium]|nr:50S ribosomal protein L5 [Melioribacteraceae bacterium]